MEAQISPIGGSPQGRDRAAAIGETEGRLPPVEHLANLVHEPRVVARFDRQLDPPRKGIEDVDQAVEVEREIRGQLEQDRSQVGAELARAFNTPYVRIFDFWRVR